jgi:hypothetical protein
MVHVQNHLDGSSSVKRLKSPSSRSEGKLSEIFLDDDDTSETYTKLVEIDNKLHLFPTKFAMNIISERVLYVRCMHPSRQQMFFRGTIGYSAAVWNAATVPLSANGSFSPTEPEHEGLLSFYRLKYMPVSQDPVKLDAARQCQWKENCWHHLSIIDFHEGPSANPASYKGISVGARNYLRDCVQGYLIFLEVR